MNVPETIQKVAPLWSGRIKKEPIKDLYVPKKKKDVTLDISLVKSCLVAEVHGFTNKYGLLGNDFCNTCDTYAHKFAAEIASEEERKLEKSLDIYGKHIESRHKDLLDA